MTTVTQPEALMALIEAYADARHKHGAPEYNAHTAAARTAVLHALTTHAGADGWKPLVRAPDTHRTVLVHLNIGKVTPANFLGDLGWDWQELDEEDGRDVFVTHWREMPAPPAPEALEVKP